MQKQNTLPWMDLFEVVTVGFPFCGFKIISGLAVAGSAEVLPVKILSYALVGLGFIDFVMNLVNFAGLLVAQRRLWRTCLLDFVFSSKWAWKDLGNSADVLLSFSLVAIVVGYGLLTTISPAQVSLWNTCVIFNVLGAGLGRMAGSLGNRAAA